MFLDKIGEKMIWRFWSRVILLSSTSPCLNVIEFVEKTMAEIEECDDDIMEEWFDQESDYEKLLNDNDD